MNTRLNTIIASALLLLTPVLTHAQSCSAKAVGFLWGKSYFSPVDLTLPTQYGSIIDTGSYYFTTVSVISINQGPNGAGTIYFEDGMYGAVNNALAAAIPYWDDQLCVDLNLITNETIVNGNCNETDKRPEAGSIVFNNTLMLDPDKPEHLTHKLVQHEIGHMFGFDHVPDSCSGVTFMTEHFFPTWPAILSASERNWLANKY